MEDKIILPLEYAKNIHKVLERYVSMGFSRVSQEAVEGLTELIEEAEKVK